MSQRASWRRYAARLVSYLSPAARGARLAISLRVNCFRQSSRAWSRGQKRLCRRRLFIRGLSLNTRSKEAVVPAGDASSGRSEGHQARCRVTGPTCRVARLRNPKVFGPILTSGKADLVLVLRDTYRHPNFSGSIPFTQEAIGRSALVIQLGTEEAGLRQEAFPVSPGFPGLPWILVSPGFPVPRGSRFPRGSLVALFSRSLRCLRGSLSSQAEPVAGHGQASPDSRKEFHHRGTAGGRGRRPRSRRRPHRPPRRRHGNRRRAGAGCRRADAARPGGRDRLTVDLPAGRLAAARATVDSTPGLTLAAFTSEALRREVARLEAERGEPFPPAGGERPSGPPIRA